MQIVALDQAGPILGVRDADDRIIGVPVVGDDAVQVFERGLGQGLVDRFPLSLADGVDQAGGLAAIEVRNRQIGGVQTA